MNDTFDINIKWKSNQLNKIDLIEVNFLQRDKFVGSLTQGKNDHSFVSTKLNYQF